MSDGPPDFPLLVDDAGYLLQARDAGFVGVSVDSLRALTSRAYPLGFSSMEDWQSCLDELREALRSDGLEGADVRIKGTAATFFSHSPGKPFPQSGAECGAQAAANGLDGTAAEGRWSGSPYADAQVIPHRAFWDSRHQLGIDSEGSDYDIQISSDALAEALRARYPDGTVRGRFYCFGAWRPLHACRVGTDVRRAGRLVGTLAGQTGTKGESGRLPRCRAGEPDLSL